MDWEVTAKAHGGAMRGLCPLGAERAGLARSASAFRASEAGSGAEPQRLTADERASHHHALDLGRALVDPQRTHFAVEPLGDHAFDDAESAVQLHGRVGGALRA